MIKELWKLIELVASIAILILFGMYLVKFCFEPTLHSSFENAVILGMIFLVDVNLIRLKKPE